MRSRMTRLGSVVRRCRMAAKQYDSNTASVFLRVARFHLKDGLTPEVIFLSGLANPKVSAHDLTGYVNKAKLLKIQSRLNPKRLKCLTEDKSVFYAYCMGLGIPIPELYAVFSPGNGWATDGRIFTTRGDWERFFLEDLPDEFLVKPATGVYGKGLRIFAKRDGGFVDAGGARCSASDF